MNSARAKAQRPLRYSGRGPQSAQRPTATVMGLGDPSLDPELEGACFSASGARSYEGSLPEGPRQTASPFDLGSEASRARAVGRSLNAFETYPVTEEEAEKVLYCHECLYIFSSYGNGWRRCPECGNPVCDHPSGSCSCLGE